VTDRNHFWRFYAGFACAVGLGIVVPSTTVAALPAARMSLEVTLAWVIILHAAVRLGALVMDGRQRILEMTFWIYVYVWLGLAAMLQVSRMSFPWPDAYPRGIIRMGLFLIAAGLVSYEVGLAAGRRHRLTRAVSFRTLEISTPRAVLLSIAAIATVAFLIHRVGGVSAILVSREEWAATLAVISGGKGKAIGAIIHALLTVPAFVALLLIWTLVRSPVRQSLYVRVCLYALLCVLVAANAIVNNPMASARAWFGTIMVSIALLGVKWRRNASMFTWVMGLIGLFIFAFPYSDVFRRSRALDFAALYTGASAAEELVSNGDYASFQQILNAIRYVKHEGHTFGYQALGTILVWVPRSIWTSKPLDSADLVATHSGYAYTNLEMPLWGEFYLDWGVPGVIVGFAFLGWLTFTLQRTISFPKARATSIQSLVVPVLAGYQLLLVRGDLMSTFIWFQIIVLCMLFAARRPRFTRELRVIGPAAISAPHWKQLAGQYHRLRDERV